MVVLTLFIVALAIRALECFLLIKRVSKACHKYDWKFVNENEIFVLEIQKENYHLTQKWSAYNFVFFNGPSPLNMFFSAKPLTIENQYNNEVVNRLNKYENI